MQRDHTTCHKYEISHSKRLAIREWPSRTLKVIRLQLLLLDRPYMNITPVSGLLLQHLYLAPFPRYYHFSSTWLPVTLRSPSPLTIKFKSQARCTFSFICKQTVVKTRYIYRVTGITKVYYSKSDPQPHSRSLAIVPYSIGHRHTWFPISLPL